MKQGTTLFLKFAVILIGIPVLILGIFGLYWLAHNPANPEYAHLLYPIVMGNGYVWIDNSILPRSISGF